MVAKTVLPAFQPHTRISTPSMEAPRLRRTQYCARCQFHRVMSPLRGHKRYCPYANCYCVGCTAVVRRRTVQAKMQALRRDQLMDAGLGSAPTDGEKEATSSEGRVCARCRHHGVTVPLRGHRYMCPFLQCTCEGCYLIRQRRSLSRAIVDCRIQQASPRPHAGTMDENKASTASDTPPVGALAPVTPSATVRWVPPMQLPGPWGSQVMGSWNSRAAELWATQRTGFDDYQRPTPLDGAGQQFDPFRFQPPPPHLKPV